MDKIKIIHCERCKGTGKVIPAGLTPQYPTNSHRCDGTGHTVYIDGDEQH